MAELAFKFDDGAAYERAMGRWSRAVAPVFLQWLAPPASARWLDVGCGTGVLAHTLLELSSPASVVGVIRKSLKSRKHHAGRRQAARLLRSPTRAGCLSRMAP